MLEDDVHSVTKIVGVFDDLDPEVGRVLPARGRGLRHGDGCAGRGGNQCDQTADGTASDDMRPVTRPVPIVAQRVPRPPRARSALRLQDQHLLAVGRCRIRVRRCGARWPPDSRPDKGERAADVGTARQARLAYAAVHDRIDEDGLAYRQIAVRLCQVADEFMAEDRAGLSTDVFTGGDMQVAAANPRVRDVDCDPARA